MAKRGLLIGLSAKILRSSGGGGLGRSPMTLFASCQSGHSVGLFLNWFSSLPASFSCRRFRSTRIVSDEFADDSFDLDGKFYVDPVTRKGKIIEKKDTDINSDIDDLPFKTRSKFARQKSYHRREPRGQYSWGSFDGDGYNHRERRPRYQHGGAFEERSSSFQSAKDMWDQLNEKKVDYSDEAPTEKNYYTEHPDVLNRPEEEIKEFMKMHEMAVRGPNIKKPILKFEETGFSDEIKKLLKTMNFDQPTPIQSIGWPHALSGSDIVGIAQTGSGKTLSFILPAILHIQEKRRTTKGKGPIALVMCPTRELAMQCHSVVRRFSRLCNVTSAVVYGGQSKLTQENKLMNPRLDIVIATPGRLIDFLTTGVVSLRKCTYLVLDEADRMLDMGFEPQIRSILGQIRPDRQVLMWSATWPEEIKDLAMDFLNEYVHVKIGSQDLTVNSDITQLFESCAPYEKSEVLFEHLRNHPSSENPRIPAKTLIFAGTKTQCFRIEHMLRSEGIRAGSLHGGKSQSQRDAVMNDFRTGRVPVLAASDVAARGLDVTDIEFVINYDLPKNIEDYIHRVGRTARAGRKGTSISYITTEDLNMVQPIMRMLRDAGLEVPEVLRELERKRSQFKAYRKHDRIIDNYSGGIHQTGIRGRPNKFRY